MAKHASVEQQREWYESELEASIGPRFVAPIGDVEKGGLVAALSTPAALVFFALITFAVTLAVLMWRDGQLGQFMSTAQQRIIANSGYAPKPATKPWVLGSNNRGTVSTDRPAEAPPATVEDPNEMEAALAAVQVNEAPKPQPAPPAETP